METVDSGKSQLQYYSLDLAGTVDDDPRPPQKPCLASQCASDSSAEDVRKLAQTLTAEIRLERLAFRGRRTNNVMLAHLGM